MRCKRYCAWCSEPYEDKDEDVRHCCFDCFYEELAQFNAQSDAENSL